MMPLTPPTFRVREVLAACIQNITDGERVTRLATVAPNLEEAENSYARLASTGELYLVNEAAWPNADVKASEIKDLYDDKFSKDGQPGRPFYNHIRASSKDLLCPLCLHREVSTLDHYLAKSKYPTFAITPINLVPACFECNKTKTAKIHTTADEMTLHPYFDSLNGAIWLTANVVESSPPALEFTVVDSGTGLLWDKLRYQYKSLGLARLYGSNAARELSQIAGCLKRLADSGGASSVMAHLAEQATSRGAYLQSSWQSAMYRALVASEWFWRGGHQHITA